MAQCDDFLRFSFSGCTFALLKRFCVTGCWLQNQTLYFDGPYRLYLYPTLLRQQIQKPYSR